MKHLVISAKKMIILAAVFLTGCASMPQMQSAMNEIDYFWGNTNQKVLNTDGVRMYSATKNEVLEAANAAAAKLGFKTSYYTDRINMVAQIPTPFTKEEYASIKKLEEPMMQAIAAKHVGKFTSNFFILSDKDFDIIADFSVSDHTTNPTVIEGKSLVAISFSLKFTGNAYGMIYGHNPPPEALRKGLKKYWDTFENELGKISD